MHLAPTVLAVVLTTVAFLGVSCSGPSSLSGSGSGGSATSQGSQPAQPATDSSAATDQKGANGASENSAEATGASPPQSVSGSFLATCGNAGTFGYGCTLIDVSSGHQVLPSAAATVQVTVQFNGGASDDHPVPTLALASAPWTFTFTVPGNKLFLLRQVSLSGTLGGQSLNTVVNNFKSYTSGTETIADAGSEVSLNSPAAVIFVTQNLYSPGQPYSKGSTHFGSASDADQICNDLAAGTTSLVANTKLSSQSFARTWVAIVGDAKGDAVARVNGLTGGISQGVYSTSGAIVADANSWENSYQQYLNPVNTDEAGFYIGSGAQVWSGVNLSASSTCNGWSSNSASQTGSYGDADIADQWLTSGSSSCNASLHLYCLGKASQ